ncbi:MMPL family transporter [Leifsonia poae]|uniref:RND transporter n=1 Tax=Leifsonia poae TaxID=110933 RepID=A0A9W6M0Z0_9MICO|nr:MMPL family transporter [Leifsonia poae]GLJ77237.1 RND transporter [Leifsonia poae]
MLTLWLAALVLIVAGAALLGTGTDNTYTIPGTESQQALDALARTFPQVSGTSAQMIVVAAKGGDIRDPAYQSAIESSVTAISAIPQVSSATSPYGTTTTGNINESSTSALVPIQLAVAQTAVTPTTMDALQAAGVTLEHALPSGSQVAVGGQVFSQTATGISITELLGIAIAFIVLVFTFASFVAAGLPLITALLGVGTSLAIITIATRFVTITSTTPLLSLMLGLAVGIDYALFIVSRHQDQVKQGLDPEESAARAVATAGSAVVFAAITVIIALLGLSVANIPFLTTMGVAAALAVAIAVVISMTLTPALLGFAGIRIVAKRYRPQPAVDEPDAAPDDVPDTEEDAEGAEDEADAPAAEAAVVPSADAEAAETPPAPPRGFFLGWVRAVTKWPIVTVVAIVAVLGLATVPAAHLRLALPDAGSLDEHAPARITYDLIAQEFGPGYNGPLIVTGSIIQSTDPVGLMNELGAEIATLPGVAAVPLSTPNETGDTGIVQVIPEGGPDSEQTKALVAGLRSMHDDFEKTYGVDLSVTGYTAAGIDISARLGQALLPFALLVVGLSLVLLAMVFRSIVVPVTAALGYLLSVGAAFGITTLVFVDGFLAGPLNVATLGSVISFMPIILMGVLFGLAMDYEVFLVSRMREDYVRFGDARHAIPSGFVGSARVVTAAAIIMFAVFAAFIPSGDASIQPIALGLAVGVAIDAFVVRMSLIPAVLMLFGDKAWWIPRWLDRALPKFDVEGEGLHRELELADWPEPGDAHAIVAEDVTVVSGGATIVDGFGVTVAAGDALVLAGDPESGRSVLLHALAGRLPVTGGRLKVAGVALPMRAATVRSRVGIARLASSPDPVDAVRVAVSNRAVIVMLDDLDAVRHPELRDDIADVLLHAARAAAKRDVSLTIVATCADPADLDGLLPRSMAVQVVHLAPARRPSLTAVS